jgi:hypothetical protein
MRSSVRVLSLFLAIGVLSMSGAGSTSYRGANITLAGVGEYEIELLASTWNANLVRIRLAAHDGCDYSAVEITDPATSTEPIFLELDRVIAACRANGLRVILDVHQFPGFSAYRMGGGDYRLWEDPLLQERFIRYWKGLALRYAEWGDVIYGYDLLNEPICPSIDDWLGLANRAARAIREVDHHRSIIVESRGGTPDTFSELRPIDDPNTIYSVHLWQPTALTMQGAWGRPTGLTYPSSVWDKEYLREVLRPVVEFQHRYGVGIFVGEFGVTAQVAADARAHYLEDALSLFEEYGFDYAFASYRKYSPYSLEHAAYVASNAVVPMYVGSTDALSTLLSYLSRNEGTPTPQSSTRPTCLFDTSHWQLGLRSNIDSLDYAWRLTGRCEVFYNNKSAITSELLQGVSLLVTGNSHGSDYRRSEIEAIEEFVRSGGALLHYEGTASSSSINRLLKPFGIQHDPTPIFSLEPAMPGDNGDSHWIDPIDRKDLVSCTDCSFLVSYAGSLTLSSCATAVATSSPETWKDTNRNEQLDDSEERGPFVIIAAAELGEGRVVGISEEGMSDVCNWMVLRGLADWLLETEGGTDSISLDAQASVENQDWSTSPPTLPNAGDAHSGFFPPYWARNRASSPMARILFDEGHGEDNTISYEQAILLDHDKPQNRSYGLLAAGLQVSHLVERTESALTPEGLSAYDVLIIPQPTRHFMASEKTAIEEFVLAGGGLFVLASWHSASPNDLLSPFGLEFTGHWVLSASAKENPHTFDTSAVAEFAGSVTPVEVMAFDCPTSIVPSEAIDALIWSGADTWLDVDNDEVQDENEPVGPFILAATVEYGSGRVVAVADNGAFIDSGIAPTPGNCTFFLNAIDWLISTPQAQENWRAEERGGRLPLDDFEEDDLTTNAGSKWTDYTWASGSFNSPVRVERDEWGGYLLLDASSNGGGVAVSSPLWSTDLSEFEGVYIELAASTRMRIGLNLLSTDEEWPSGERDTYVARQILASDEPNAIRIPFTSFIVEESKRDRCPECSIGIDPSRLSLLGIEILSGSGECRIHEVGFYRE